MSVLTAVVGAAACGGSPVAPAPTPSACSFTVADGPAGDIAAAGGEFTVGVTTTAACEWTVSSSAAFITAGATTGKGSGSITFNVAPNAGSSRQGAIQVAGRTLTVSQAAGAAGCEFSIDPAQASVASTGGSVSVVVTRTNGADCAWTATSHDTFITVQSGASGTDNGATVLTVAAHSGAARTGTATVAGRVVTISQAAPCGFAVSPTTIPTASAGGPALLNITLTSGSPNCAWTAQSNSGFITVGNGSGVGPGTVAITVAANTGSARTGSVTVGGQTVTINQVGSIAGPNAIAVLTYQSAPGDYIGQGLSDTFTRNGTQFQVTVNSSQSQLAFSIPPSGGTWWNLTLKSPGGPLAAGTYNQAGRASSAPAGQAGLDFSGSGRGCNRLTGRFLVQTAEFFGTDLVRFHARFEQYCEGYSTPLRGQIWIDAAGAAPPPLADLPSPPATPTTVFTYTSDPGDYVGGGQSGSFTLSGQKFIAWTDAPRGVQITMQSAVGAPTAFWSFAFSAASGTQLQPGTYTGATRHPFNAGVPGLSVTGGSRGCNTLTGSFVVHEAVYGWQGEVLRFHATFEQHCEGAIPALRGELRIVADPWR